MKKKKKKERKKRVEQKSNKRLISQFVFFLFFFFPFLHISWVTFEIFPPPHFSLLDFLSLSLSLSLFLSVKWDAGHFSQLLFLQLIPRTDCTGHLNPAALPPGTVDMLHALPVDDDSVTFPPDMHRTTTTTTTTTTLVGLITFILYIHTVVVVVVIGGAHSLRCRQKCAKHKVLHDGELAEDLFFVHEDHALVDFCPVERAADVVEHGAVPAQAGRGLDGVDELDAPEVHVLLAVLAQHVLVVDALWPQVRVRVQLRRPKQERKELVVVQPPHAVRPCRLKVVCRL